jgi:hypothetical protein
MGAALVEIYGMGAHFVDADLVDLCYQLRGFSVVDIFYVISAVIDIVTERKSSVQLTHRDCMYDDRYCLDFKGTVLIVVVGQ